GEHGEDARLRFAIHRRERRGFAEPGGPIVEAHVHEHVVSDHLGAGRDAERLDQRNVERSEGELSNARHAGREYTAVVRWRASRRPSSASNGCSSSRCLPSAGSWPKDGGLPDCYDSLVAPLARQTVSNAPKYGENSVGQSA